MPISGKLSSKTQTYSGSLTSHGLEENCVLKGQDSDLSADKAEVAFQGNSSDLVAKFFHISKLDPNMIQEGRLDISMPLIYGIHLFPGMHSDVKVKVKKDARAVICMAVERKNEESVIKGASVEFNPPLKIKNPASAFNHKSRFSDAFRDMIADVILKGFQVSSDGKIHLDGYISLGIFGSRDIESVMDGHSFPQIDMRLKSLLEKAAEMSRQKQDNHLPKSKWTLFEVLKQFGAATERATYSLGLKTDPLSVSLNLEKFSAWTQDSSTSIQFGGAAKVTSDGEIEIASDPNRSFVNVDGIRSNIRAEAVVSSLDQETPTVLGHVGVHSFVDKLNANAKIPQANIPLTVGGQNNFAQAHGFFSHHQDNIKLNPDSSLMTRLDAKMEGNLSVEHAPLKIVVQNANFHVEGGMSGAVEKGDFQISDGELRTQTQIAKVNAAALGYEIDVPGHIKMDVHASQFLKTGEMAYPAFKGRLNFSLNVEEDPTGLLPPFEQALSFDFKSLAKVKVEPLNDGLTEFLKPFADAVLFPQLVCDPKSPAAGEIGSKAWRKRIEEVTATPIHPGNKLEVLIDGINSHKKRLEMIGKAQKSICVQSLIFNDDETGMETAQALVEAKKRGVEVYVIVDALGNDFLGSDNIVNKLMKGNKALRLLEANGVNLKLFNDNLQKGIKEIFEVIASAPALLEGISSNITSISNALQAAHFVLGVANGKIDVNLSAENFDKLRMGLARLFGHKEGMSIQKVLDELFSLTEDNKIEIAELAKVLQRFTYALYHWHEKRLVVDGKEAVMGGMNIANHYLLGGLAQLVSGNKKERPAYRDTDVYFAGPAVSDAYEQFAHNWEDLTGHRLPKIPPAEGERDEKIELQVIQNRPQEFGTHRITNLWIESLKSLRAGEKFYAASAYFSPSGALERYAEALIDAAQRGVDVRIVTNSQSTTDYPQVNQAAQSAVYRKLLAGGVRLFERTGDRTMHSKVTSIGSKVAIVGSANGNNRSASLDGEDVVVIHNERKALEIEEMILADMDKSVAKELHLADIEYTPLLDELENAAWATFKNII